MLKEIFESSWNIDHFGKSLNVILAGKIDFSVFQTLGPVTHIERSNRHDIWERFKQCKIALNISKDLYVDKGFIPARVYEAIMFGCIPVSYKMPQIHPALSFSNKEEFVQIVKYILELEKDDYLALYHKVIDSILDINKNKSRAIDEVLNK